MSDEWIKFDDRRPLDGQLIWPGNHEHVMGVPARYRSGDDMMSYTHWKPCVRPAPPKRLPVLPDGFVFTRHGRLAISSAYGNSRVVFYNSNGALCVTLTAQNRHLAAQLIAAFDEEEAQQ